MRGVIARDAQHALIRRIGSIFLPLARIKQKIPAAAVLDEFFHRDGTQPAEFFILAPWLCPVPAAPFLNGEQRNVGIIDAAEYDLLPKDYVERRRTPAAGMYALPVCAGDRLAHKNDVPAGERQPCRTAVERVFSRRQIDAAAASTHAHALHRDGVCRLIDAVILLPHADRRARRELHAGQDDIRRQHAQQHGSAPDRAAHSVRFSLDRFHGCASLPGSGISTSTCSPSRS